VRLPVDWYGIMPEIRRIYISRLGCLLLVISLMPQDLLHKAFDLHSWINQHLDDLDVPRNSRSLMSVLCHDVVIEHHLATTTLLHKGVNGTAFALVRLVFDSCVRGIWLRWCATDSEIRNYEKDTLRLEFGKMLEAVEQVEGFEDRVLSQLKHRSWKAMNSYAHTGILQLSRRAAGNEIRPQYTREEIDEVVRLTGFFALLSFQQIAAEAGRTDLANAALDRLDGKSAFL